jgi:guanylate kinase
VDGKDYHFVDTDTFRDMIERDGFLEHARVFDNFYGTSKGSVQAQLAAGRDVILEIDWQGARQVRESMPECITIFIMPPSHDELVRRLRSRGTDSDDVVERRLRDALSDMAHWDEFDYVVINDNLDQAVADLESVLAGEGAALATSNAALRRAVAGILRL